MSVVPLPHGVDFTDDRASALSSPPRMRFLSSGHPYSGAGHRPRIPLRCYLFVDVRNQHVALNRRRQPRALDLQRLIHPSPSDTIAGTR